MGRAPLVAMHDITRRFGPVLANDAVSLALEPGEIHGLVGENGAGKSTLMRILYGLVAPDAGRIEVDGRQVRIHRPADAIRLGIGMVHQHFMLVDPLTVAENVTLGREPRGTLGAYDAAAAAHAVEALSRRVGLPLDPHARVRDLSVGAQQRVEIVKALHHGARVLILDEPTAVLTPQEVDELFAVLRALQADGTTIVLITHKLAEVKAVAQRVTVMRAGRVAGGAPAAELSIERLAELVVGHPLAPLHARAELAPGEHRLDVRGLEVKDARGLPAVRGVSFVVRAGEIVGIAGVEGNGQQELVECIAGLAPAAAGRVTIGGRDVTARPVRARFAAGLAHIPGDRLKRGLVPPMSLAENVALGREREPAFGHGPMLSHARLAARTRELVEEFDVRPPRPDALARQLSGGNQQKLVAARELTRGASLVLASHPTRGVDLGAVAFLHRRLLAERDAGNAVLLVSSELTEILALADRILVLYEGRIVHETTPGATDERTLGLYMTGRRGRAA
ncbi:MAG TPA: ABC transporter ATP-binding protein [Candidatus Eisenbacteria bacterium]|nr:ABC transporter ATP-binding protein [Candidatus Eisenbacteria bacterium]